MTASAADLEKRPVLGPWAVERPDRRPGGLRGPGSPLHAQILLNSKALLPYRARILLGPACFCN